MAPYLSSRPQLRHVHAPSPLCKRPCAIVSFFDRGALRLTTYESCRILPNVLTRDEEDGKGSLLLRDSSPQVMAVRQIVAASNHMLCTSTVISDAHMAEFDAKDYFVIEDVDGFIQAVADVPPGYIDHFHGPCNYQPERGLGYRGSETPDVFGELQRAALTGVGNIEEIFNASNRKIAEHLHQTTGNDIYFLKPDRYASNKEHRIVWRMDRINVEPQVYLVPEASKYCRRAVR